MKNIINVSINVVSSTRVKRMKGLLLASIVAVSGVSSSLHAQEFQQSGPSQEIGVLGVGNGNDGPNDRPLGERPTMGTGTGAVQSIAIDPSNDKNILVGTTNGGIWKSVDGGLTWTATTDTKGSLSIGSVNYDLSDPTGLTAIGSVAITSSGAIFGLGGGSPISYFDLSRGGATNNGLLLTTDGGSTWETIGAEALPDLSILNATVRGQTIMAAAFAEEGSWAWGGGVEAGSGLYRSTDNGATFTKLGAESGLEEGAASALVGDPNDPNRFYVGITQAGGGELNATTALFTSTDGGVTWAKIFSAENTTSIKEEDTTMLRVATGPNGSVVVGVVNGTEGQMNHVFLSKDYGANWYDLSEAVDPANSATEGEHEEGAKKPVFGEYPINAGGQAGIHSVVAIDPKDPNIVYVAGDRVAQYGENGWSAAILRINLGENGSYTYSTITDEHTADGASIHPDVRAAAFDSNGNLYFGSDGGLYYRTTPTSSEGTFYGLNSGRQNLEIYNMALDPNTGLLLVAAQDNGTAIKAQVGVDPTTNIFNIINGGDGTIAAINGTSLVNGLSYSYSSCQLMCGNSIYRYAFDKNSNTNYDPAVNLVLTDKGGVPLDFSDALFVPPFVLNHTDQTLIATSSGANVLITQDDLTSSGDEYGSLYLPTHQVAGTIGYVQSLDFGTNDNPYALLTGSSLGWGDSHLSVSAGADLASMELRPVMSYEELSYNGNLALGPTSVIFDPRSQNRFYAVDTNLAYGTKDGGATGELLNTYFPKTFTRPTTLGFISSNGVNALLVGGLNIGDDQGNPLLVADSDDAGVLSDWRRFGTGLPNAQISAMDYQGAIDTLAIGTFGRGTFTLFDVTSYFPTATTLQFGLANNDSHPDAKFLTGDRPLNKYGTGTLTLTGTPTFTGDVTLFEGTTQISEDANLGDVANSLIFNGGALQLLGDVDTARTVDVQSDYSVVDTNGFHGTITGDINGAGSLLKVGDGTLTLSGLTNLANGAYVGSGNLEVAGVLAAPVAVLQGATLSGSGYVSGSVVLDGGTLQSYGAQSDVGMELKSALGVTAGTDATAPAGLTIGSLSSTDNGGTFNLGYNSKGMATLNVLGSADISGITLKLSSIDGSSLGYKSQFIALRAGQLKGVFENSSAFTPIADGSNIYQRPRYDLLANAVVWDVVQNQDWSLSEEGPVEGNPSAVGEVINKYQLNDGTAFVGGLSGSDRFLRAMSGLANSDLSKQVQNLEGVSGSANLNAAALNNSSLNSFQSMISRHIFSGGNNNAVDGMLATSAIRHLNPGDTDTSKIVALAESNLAGGSRHGKGDGAPIAVWAQAYAADNTLNMPGNSMGINSAGFAQGIDLSLGEHLSAGLAAGISSGDTEQSALGLKSKANYYQLGAYLTANIDGWIIGASTAYQDSRQHLNRDFTASGGANYKAGALSKSHETNHSFFAGNAALLKLKDLRVGVSNSINVIKASASPYAETGGDALALSVGSVSQKQTWNDFNLTIEQQIPMKKSMLIPSISLDQRSLISGKTDAIANVSYQIIPASSMTIRGAKMPENQTRLGVGMEYQSGNFSIRTKLERSLSSAFKENIGSIGLQYSW